MPPTVKANKQITIRQVASHALVSVGTVSRVFNNHSNVEAELRSRVLNAAQELGYVHRPRRTNVNEQNHNGKNGFSSYQHDERASKGKREISHLAICCRAGLGSVSVIAQNPYFSLVLHGAEAECRENGQHLLYQVLEDDVSDLERATQNLKKSGAEALVLVNFTDEQLVSGLLELNLPAVLIDHYFPDLPLDVVMNENFAGATRVMKHLIKQGHRRIGFLDGLPHYTVKRRREGYRAALEDAGIPFDPNLIIEGNLSIESGVRAAAEMLERRLDCTAFFCANDSSAIGFIQGLNEHGLRVPADISVVGFDDIEAAKIISPPLTTVRTNADQLGRMAVRRLMDRVDDPTLPITQTLLQSNLIERRSVKSI